MRADRTSVGLTERSQVLLEEIQSHGWFATGQEAARFCFGYAIREGVEEGETPSTDTQWTVGLFDETGDMRTLVSALYPDCDAPVRLITHLTNEGIRMVAARLESGTASPADLVGVQVSPGPPQGRDWARQVADGA